MVSRTSTFISRKVVEPLMGATISGAAVVLGVTKLSSALLRHDHQDTAMGAALIASGVTAAAATISIHRELTYFQRRERLAEKGLGQLFLRADNDP